MSAVVLSAGCATGGTGPTGASREDIFVLRSIREPQAPGASCGSSLTGFEPFTADAERQFSFWSVRTRAKDGRVVDAAQVRVANLRGCFGPTADRARQHFYAEIQLGALNFRGKGECLALAVDFPEPGLFPVRCQLILSQLPAPYVGGTLTTNTITSGANFGGNTQPPGYTQASIATLRLWKTPGDEHERTERRSALSAARGPAKRGIRGGRRLAVAGGCHGE